MAGCGCPRAGVPTESYAWYYGVAREYHFLFFARINHIFLDTKDTPKYNQIFVLELLLLLRRKRRKTREEQTEHFTNTSNDSQRLFIAGYKIQSPVAPGPSSILCAYSPSCSASSSPVDWLFSPFQTTSTAGIANHKTPSPQR